MARHDAGDMLSALASIRRHPIRTAVATVAVAGGVAAGSHGQPTPTHDPPRPVAHRSSPAPTATATTTAPDSDWATDSATGLLVNSQTGDVYDPDSGLLYYAATGRVFDPHTGKFLDQRKTNTSGRKSDADATDRKDQPAPDKTLTPSDWNDVCAGGAVCDPDDGGLPPFNPGGGLRFGTP